MRLKSGLLIGIFGLIVVLLGGWFFTLATALLTYLALLEFFRMAEFKGIKPATKTTLFSSFVIIISTYLETIGLIEGEISNSILPICSVVICTWLLLQPKPGTISDIAASIFGLFWNLICIAYFAYFIFDDYWFEKSLIEFGNSTGVVASGLLLLRLADPKNISKTLTNFYVKTAFRSVNSFWGTIHSSCTISDF